VAVLAAVSLALGAIMAPVSASAGVGSAIKPDAACADEADFKSLKGDNEASLTVINDSDEVVRSWWLNYEGERVFYQELAPHTRYVQDTWLTHPWVISSVEGDCYRFLVMTSVQQIVTVKPEIPDPEATAAVVTARPEASAPPRPTVPPPTGVAAGPTTPATSTDFLPFLIMGVLASIFVVIGGMAATGRLPGMRRGRPGP
jgi:hypothetical protein